MSSQHGRVVGLPESNGGVPKLAVERGVSANRDGR